MREQEYSYFQDPEFLDILNRYEGIVKQGSCGYMDADDLADVADFYYNNHRRTEGDACIDFGLTLHPHSSDLLTFKARSQMLGRDYANASLTLDEAEDQEHREVIYLRAELMIVEGKRLAADRYLQEHYPADEAEEDFEADSADEAEESRQRSYVREVIGLWLDYEDANRAAPWVERLKALPSLNTKDRIMLADYACQAGQNKVARSILGDIVETEPYNTNAWNLLAEVMLDDEELQEAADSCETVLAIEEDNYQAWTLLGRICYESGNFAKVISHMQKGRERWPQDEICPLYEGMARVQLYSNSEPADVIQLQAAYECLKEAEQKSRGQSTEQANIILNLAYVSSEFYYITIDTAVKAKFRKQVVEYVQQMRQFPKELNQVSFQLSNMLFELGEDAMARSILGSVLKTQKK